MAEVVTLTPEQVDQVVKFMESYNGLTHDAKLYVFLIALVVLGVFALNRLLNHRQAKQAEEMKDKRASGYLSALASLGDDMRDHMDQDRQNMDRISAVLMAVKDRVHGVMTLEDSLRVVEAYYANINSEAASILQDSMEENDFANRREYVERKVKTRVAEIIADAQTSLHRFPLAFDPDVFFRIYKVDDGAERFILCDQIWSTMTNLFEVHTPVHQRLDEMRLLVTNTMRDQFSHISRKLWERRQAPQGTTPPILKAIKNP